MDMRYIRYIQTNKKYYEPVESHDTYVFKTSDIPKGWKTERDDHWTFCFPSDAVLPIQGWKIHISAVPKHAQHTLDLISYFLFEKSIPFKYVSKLRELVYKNSKYGDRGSSGKFMAIYPKHEEQFIFLLDRLHNILEQTPKGPYILNDKRWYGGNVYFRYGAFELMYKRDSATKVPVIETPDGDYMTDHRGPSYRVPYFVEEPIIIQEMTEKEEIDQANEEARLNHYDIQSALHFSNGGGVYFAYHGLSGKEVVIKEGRPEAGLDGQGRDAIERLNHEATILKDLRGVDSTVEYIDFFQEWEHIFLIEEYIPGTPLSTLMATSYPFYKNSTPEEYSDHMISLFEKIITAVQDIHSHGIGIGDLQPANIIVTPSDEIKLIDFETAGNIEETRRPGLGTPGFMGSLDSTNEQSDWFALLSLARQIFVATGPVRDMAEDILAKHDKWIRKHFGHKAIKTVEELEFACKARSVNRGESILSAPEIYFDKTDIPQIIKKTRQGIIQDLGESDNPILLPGDIRQYELPGGMMNVLTGGFGVVMALKRTGTLPDNAKKWAVKYSDDPLINNLDDGLFTGKSGVAGVLYEIGMKERAKEIYESTSIDTDSEDISIRSGLSGMGIALLSASKLYQSDSLFKKTLQIAHNLEQLLGYGVTVTSNDVATVPIGLFDGWSGVSLFFSILYEYTDDKHWLNMSISAIENDLDQCQFDKSNSFQVKDEYGRLLPYLAGGSAGIAFPIIELHHLLKSDKWGDELNGIRTAITPRCAYNSGLFHGLSGLITAANALEVEHGYGADDINELVEMINLFILEDDGGYFVPGHYGYKVSGDIFSGASGMLLALNNIGKPGYTWLPVPGISGLLPSYRTSAARTQSKARMTKKS